MYKVEFIAQLGDIIDSKAKKNKGSDIELSKVIFFINIFIKIKIFRCTGLR